MTDATREVQCRRTVNDGKDRCPWRGPLSDFAEHTAETRAAGDAHQACIVCRRPLPDHVRQTCGECVKATFDALSEIETGCALSTDVIHHAGYRMNSGVPAEDLLAMTSDGSLSTLWPYKPPAGDLPVVELERAELPTGRDTQGHPVVHPAYVERRAPRTGREHFADHWRNDPVSVLAWLEVNERDWRHTFGHQPADDLATVSGCLGYLRQWLNLAASTHEAFDDFAREAHAIARRLGRNVGTTDDPEDSDVPCLTCGTELQRDFRPPEHTLAERVQRARSWIARDDERHARGRKVPDRLTRLRHALAGSDREGLNPKWSCPRCHRRYTEDEYLGAQRHHLIHGEASERWETIHRAAYLFDRPFRTVQAWMRDEEAVRSTVAADGRRLVWLPDVKAMNKTAARRKSRSA